MSTWAMVFALGVAAGLNLVSALIETREKNHRAVALHLAALSLCAACSGVLAGVFGG